MSSDTALSRDEFNEEIIDLRGMWQTVYRRKWSIISLSFIIVLLTTLVVFSLTPIYKATATLLIEPEETQVLSIEQMYGVSGGSEYLLTQFELLKSRALAEKIVTELDLVHHPLFDPEQQPEPFIDKKALLLSVAEYLPVTMPEDITNSSEATESEIFDSVVREFMEVITVSPVRKTQLVKVSVTLADATLARIAANAIVNGYISSQLDARVTMTLSATTWMNERIVELKSKLKESELILQQYREQENLLDVEGVTSVSASELTLSNDLLATASKERSGAESEYRQVQSMKEAGWRSQTSVPAVVTNSLVQEFKATEAKARSKVEELSRRYGEKHPKMKAARSDLETATASLKQQVLVIVSGIEKKYQLARSAEQSLKRKVSTSKGTIQNIKRKEFKLSELQREVDTNRALYDTFLTRLKETSATTDIDSANARVVDKAVQPNKPIKPKKSLIIALSGVLSLMLGIMLAFLLESLHNTFKSVEDVEKHLGLAVLGILPLVKGKERKTVSHLVLNDSNKAFSESTRSIRTSIVLSSLKSLHKVILVTSSTPGEGKSAVSSNLALSLGQMEKVLLIDADMRRPTVGKNYDVPVGSVGLANLIANTATFEECLHHIDGIDVISAGIVPPNPLELLSSKRFTKIIDKLVTVYDRIVIDSPPIQAVSDALILATQARAIIYVVKSDKTSIPMVKKGVGQLLQNNAAVTGVVLNQVDIKKSQKYGSSYEGYYDYYGYHKAK